MAAGLALTLPGIATAAPTEEWAVMVERRLAEGGARLRLTDEQITLRLPAPRPANPASARPRSVDISRRLFR